MAAARSPTGPRNSSPLAATASRAATRANWLKRSSSSRRFSSKCCAGSKSATSAPILTVSRSVGVTVRGPMADRPSFSATAISAVLRPMAEMHPMPVTTTLFIWTRPCGAGWRERKKISRRLLTLREVLADHGDYIAHRLEAGARGVRAFVGIIRDGDVEALLDLEDDLHDIQRIQRQGGQLCPWRHAAAIG